MKRGNLTINRKAGEAYVLQTDSGPIYILQAWDDRRSCPRIVINAPPSVRIEREEIAGPEDQARMAFMWGPPNTPERFES